ncbi:MAG: RNA polymerase sigma-70 factor [Bacteroidetes bacterium]|nr:RNA polymerase sigma-70 factor [Bacteroidota bacterium]
MNKPGLSEKNKNTDQKLVKTLKKGDVFAFNELFHKYSQKVYNFSIKHLENEEDVKDLVQEIFMKIWDKRKEIDANKSFNGFLFTITLNLIRNYFRKKVKDRKLVNKWLEETEPYSDSTKLSIEFRSLEKVVNTIVEQLPPKRRMVFRLSRNEGISNDDIARRMNIQKKTVENHLNLALRYLRERLQEQSFLVILFFVLFY